MFWSSPPALGQVSELQVPSAAWARHWTTSKPSVPSIGYRGSVPGTVSPGMAERPGYGADHAEPQRGPQSDRRCVRLDHGVELHAVVPLLVGPGQCVFAERPTRAPSGMLRIDQSWPWPHVIRDRPGCGASSPCRAAAVVVDGDHGVSRRYQHPDHLRLVGVELAVVGVGLAVGDDPAHERPHARPVVRRRRPDQHLLYQVKTTHPSASPHRGPSPHDGGGVTGGQSGFPRRVGVDGGHATASRP